MSAGMSAGAADANEALMEPLSAEELARGEALLARIVDFAHLLWELGLEVGPGRLLEAVGCLPLVEVGQRAAFYDALKVNFVSRREQQAVFDAAFAYFWRGQATGAAAGLPPDLEAARRRRLALPAERRGAEAEETRRQGTPTAARHPATRLAQAARMPREVQAEEAPTARAYSAEEALRHKDFVEFDADELRAARLLMERFHWRLGQRRTRRLRRARHGRALDLRATFRRSLASAGEPITLARRARRWKPRPLVVICDISGSMSLYSRLLLQFIHSLANGLEQPVEAFVFATRLTRITRQLTRRDVDAAISEVTQAVQDWSGGTRIGESLRAFNYQWARRVLGQGAVALIISDGWDRGDVRLLKTEMARLRRNCHRLIWLNPLLGQEEYRPVTSGMRVALPFLDDFLPAHNLDSLFALARLLETVGETRRSG